MKVNLKSNKLGKLFCISGPSGSGKTTLLATLLEDKKILQFLGKSCSLTTRPKRSGEREGKDYYFVSKQEFSNLLKTKKILESTRYLGYYYGTPKEPLERQLKKGKHLGLCVDLKGARILKRLYPKNTITIFVLPPSLATLKKRIKDRCSKTKQKEIRQRLILARKELLAAEKFDYCILNKDFKVALNDLKNIILTQS